MALSIVNGFLCFCSCDVAKAKKGENPHPDPNKTDKDKKHGALSLARADRPAVTFGGTLSDTASADGVKAVNGAQPADAATLWTQQFAVDMLA